MQRFSLGLNQTSFGANNPISAAASRIGSAKSKVGSTSRIFNYCKEHSPAPSLCINQFVNITNNNEKYYKFYHIAQILPSNFPAPPLGKPPYKPSDIRTAYNVPTINNTNGARKVIITIIIAYHDPNLLLNLTNFCRTYNLPSPTNQTLTVYNLGPSNNYNDSGSKESNLDVQWSYAMNPNAKIRVVEAVSTSSNDVLNAIKFANNKNNFNPPISTDFMSISMGWDDLGGQPSYNNYFNNPSTCYFASSGDYGLPSWPSTVPNVISVGGTYLQTNTQYNRTNETVWDATGVGYSDSFPRPSYQPTDYINHADVQRRYVPDIVAIGSEQSQVLVLRMIKNNAGQLIPQNMAMAGTSVSCPLTVGLLSLAVQARLNNGINIPLTTVQQNITTQLKLQQVLYSYNGFTQLPAFYDVTQGSAESYNAHKNYDVPSGLGVLNIGNLIYLLVNY
jgi:subtilase family serine protease